MKPNQCIIKNLQPKHVKKWLDMVVNSNCMCTVCAGYFQGHYPYPDASKWTDAELGIPPDDED